MAAELTKLEQETIKKFQTTTQNSESKDTSTTSVASSNEKIEKLTKLLKENIKLAKVEVGDDVKTARQSVISCLKENPGKSLNCWNEVEEFRRLAKEL